MDQLLTGSGSDSFKHRVSSTLNRSSDYASKHMFDGTDDTCWNSDQGTPQYVLIEFPTRVQVSRVGLMFQGGFVGQDATIQVGDALTEGAMVTIATLETIEDSNRMQFFDLIKFPCADSAASPVKTAGCYVKITFPTSTDFYGRVTLYMLEVWGYPMV